MAPTGSQETIGKVIEYSPATEILFNHESPRGGRLS
jgi:hypothetical protein